MLLAELLEILDLLLLLLNGSLIVHLLLLIVKLSPALRSLDQNFLSLLASTFELADEDAVARHPGDEGDSVFFQTFLLLFGLVQELLALLLVLLGLLLRNLLPLFRGRFHPVYGFLLLALVFSDK